MHTSPCDLSEVGVVHLLRVLVMALLCEVAVISPGCHLGL